MTLPDNGLHDGIPEKAYHADPRSLSSTGAKTLLYQGARAFKWQQTHATHKDAYDFGSVVHALILGVGDIAVVEAATWAGKAAREERVAARAAGKTPILAKDYHTALAMADAVSENALAESLLATGRPEVSMWATDPATGVLMRGRIDSLAASSFSDVKTAAGAVDPREFSWTVRKYHYTFQAAWYQRILALNGYTDLPPYWIAVSKDAPHEVYVHQPSPDMLVAARDDVDEALRLYRECSDTDTWPGLADANTIHTLTDTPWITDEEEEVVYG